MRTAESVAVLDLLSDGRVEFGSGRSATRAELEGFGIHPDDTRDMWEVGLRSVVEADHAGTNHRTIDYLVDVSAGVVGSPDDCIEHAKKYEAAGCDLLLCLLNPYKIPHENVMQSIELLGKHVLPEFA